MQDMNFKSISVGDNHSMAIDENDNLWTWGNNTFGQLGDGYNSDRSIPQMIISQTKFSTIACGSSHSLALDISGNLWAWGQNYFGQLGDVTFIDSPTPVKILDGKIFVAIACGGYHTLAIDNSGKLWIWGSNQYGQCGDNTAWHEIPIWLNNNQSTNLQTIKLSNDLTVFGEHGKIRIQSEHDGFYRIYNIMGSMIKTGRFQSGESYIDLEPGIYIFNASDSSYKIIIK
jgi:alpha-tubulin suppressor-like RCC1 family protein